MHLAILIPAFNEAATIEQLIAQIPERPAGISRVSILVIDDGSSDDTGRRAEAAGATVISHGRNLGLASTFRTAVQAALATRADAAVTMDADLQFYPEDIHALLEPVVAGRADFVAGDRFAGGNKPVSMPAAKYHGNRAMTFAVNRITGGRFSDVSSGYRAYSHEALLHLNVQSSFTYTQETFIELAAKGLRIEQVPVRVEYYPERRSYISGNLLRYGVRTLFTIIRAARDYAPFTVFGIAALVFAIPGLLLGIFVGAHYVLYGSFTPYIFVAFASVYLFSLGLALFVIGLAADMLRGLRTNQERLLYFQKRQFFDGGHQREES